MEEKLDKVFTGFLGKVTKMLGFNLVDDRVILSQLGRAGGEDFNLMTEEVEELGVILLEDI